MFVIVLEYNQPIEKTLEKVTAAMPGHMAFLNQHYASGHFLLSGRREPRNGGVIIARGKNRSEIEELVKLDPFHQQNLAQYTIFEFHPTMAANELAAFKVA